MTRMDAGEVGTSGHRRTRKCTTTPNFATDEWLPFRRNSMTKQEISEAIMSCAQKLGRVPSMLEVMKMGQVSRRQIRAEFGSFTQALRECNLEREIISGQRVAL